LFQIHVCFFHVHYTKSHISFLSQFLSLTIRFLSPIHCSSSVQCAYISSCYPHLIKPFPMPRFIPLSLTVVSHKIDILTVSVNKLSVRIPILWPVDLSPNPQSEGTVRRIYNPPGCMAQLYP